MEELKKIRDVAVRAATDAGKFILSRTNDIKTISHKGGINNLVTDVDKASEKKIIDIISGEFPSHSILAEESGREEREGGYTWVIDPLDGTTNFAHALPIFCVSIGVTFAGSSRVGVVYDPSRDELFTAVKGQGAFLNGSAIKTSGIGTVQESLVATGFSYNVERKISNIDNFTTMLKKAQAVRRPGAAAIDLCYVACGRFDAFWELELSPWDTAAGYLIVEEAGGKVTFFNGNNFDIFGDQILATNGNIHDEMLELIN